MHIRYPNVSKQNLKELVNGTHAKTIRGSKRTWTRYSLPRECVALSKVGRKGGTEPGIDTFPYASVMLFMILFLSLTGGQSTPYWQDRARSILFVGCLEILIPSV